MLDNTDGRKILMMSDKDLLIFLDAFYSRIKSDHEIKEDEWIDSEEAMKLLKISTTSLYKLRVGGHITISQYNKTILYSRSSIMEFIAKHKKSAFR